MPASAALPPSVPFPVASAPHASGTRIAQQPAHLLMRPQHKHGHSADYADSNQAQKSTRSHHAHARLSEQMLSKPLPIKPEQEHDIYSRPTDAQRYRDQSLQKLEEREGYRGPSLDLPRSQATSSSLGRSRSATVAAPHSSGSRGSTGAKRKPVQASPAEYFEWAPGEEAQVIASPTANDMPTGSHKSRNRNMGVYRDPPVHPKDTWSRATAPKLNERQGLSASVGHQPTSHFVISSSSLGRHHHSASASVPSTTLPGSARSTIQNFPTTPTPANTSSSNQKIPFISTSTANTPTPKAQTFNKISTKQYKHSSVSNQDLPSEERRRKLSHHRTASASTNPQSPSSCSTTGSSHADTLHSTASQEPRQRRRGISDAAAHQTYHIAAPIGRSEVSVVKIGGDEEERGRTKDKKDSSIIGRLRTRSNSFTKTLSNLIPYPKYLKKDKEKEKDKEAKRLSKQQQAQSQSNLGQSGSAILTSASDTGHSFAYSYTSSNSTATSASTAASPVSSRNHSAQPQPPPQRRKLLHSARDQQMKNDYRASPMTRAKNELLDNYWGEVDLPRRESGVPPMQIQVSETRTRLGPMIPFMSDEPKPRRR